jgi:hypothetical protein
MGFVRINSISDVPLALGLAFGQFTLTTLIFLGGAAFTGATLAVGTFTFLATVFFDTLTFCFFVAVMKASVPESGRGA